MRSRKNPDLHVKIHFVDFFLSFCDMKLNFPESEWMIEDSAPPVVTVVGTCLHQNIGGILDPLQLFS